MPIGRRYSLGSASVPSPSDRTSLLIDRVAPDATAARLAARHVELVAARWTPDVEIAVALAATLLLRLDQFAPVLHLRVPKDRSRRLPRLTAHPLFEALTNEYQGFSSVDRLTQNAAADPCVRLVFGGTTGGVSVNSSGWRVSIGEDAGLGSGNELTAAYAGVMASTEALQALLEPFGARIRRFRGTVSLWDLALDGADGPALPESLSLDRLAFAACGGVATGALWTLGLLPLTGSPVLVDPDTIDDEATNLNRHLTAGFGDIGSPKAQLAASVLEAAGASPVVRIERWRENSGDLEVVIVSPDDDAVRREVQLSMPKWLLNGGTNDDGMYIVSRHDFLHEACLSCVARSDLADRSPLAASARRLGLAEDDLVQYLRSPDPLPAGVVAKASRLTDEERTDLSLVPGQDLMGHVCGALHPTATAPAVSAPMLSAAPGVLLAAEYVRLQLGHPTHPSVTMASILAGPHERWTYVRRKMPDCVCTENLYREHFRRKWAFPRV